MVWFETSKHTYFFLSYVCNRESVVTLYPSDHRTFGPMRKGVAFLFFGKMEN